MMSIKQIYYAINSMWRWNDCCRNQFSPEQFVFACERIWTMIPCDVVHLSIRGAHSLYLHIGNRLLYEFRQIYSQINRTQIFLFIDIEIKLFNDYISFITTHRRDVKLTRGQTTLDIGHFRSKIVRTSLLRNFSSNFFFHFRFFFLPRRNARRVN